MNKTLLAIIIVAVILTGSAFAYKTYKNNLTQAAVQQSLSTGSSSNTTKVPGNKAVDPASSPQEQHVQQELNSLDNGNHN